MEESLSMSEGSRGTVAWIQQKASIASVFTPDLLQKFCQLYPYHYYAGIKPCVEDTVYGVPKVLFCRCERGHTRQEKHSHLFLFDDDNHDNYDDNHDDNDDNNDANDDDENNDDDNDDDDASVALIN